MSGFKRIPSEIKDQVLARAKEGIPVVQLSHEHGISAKTIYTWIAKSSGVTPGLLTFAKLKREKEDLLRLVGEISLKLARREKNHDG
jgi:hypothetical protein